MKTKILKSLVKIKNNKHIKKGIDAVKNNKHIGKALNKVKTIKMPKVKITL